MSIPTAPYVPKTAEEILGEILEHVTIGIIKIDNEQITYESGTDTYTLDCGLPDLTTGQLVEINRVWGTSSDNFKEFVETDDFTVDLPNNQMTFITTPNNNSTVYVSYRYDGQKTSGITDVSEGSVFRTIAAAVSRQLSAGWESLTQIQASAYIDSAIGDDLDDLLALVGVTRNAATVSTGFVTFYRETSTGDSLIASGTLVTANTRDGNIVFETTEDVYFRDGFTSVRAPIQALDLYEGDKSNMSPNQIVQLEGASGGASRVNNPSYYTDYELLELIDGKYTYELTFPPRRVINSEGFVGASPPWAVTDKGVIAVLSLKDESMTTSDWTGTSVVLTADDPEAGQLKCVPSVSTGYMARTFELDLGVYDHVWLLIRGTVDDAFEIQINSTTISMYEFQSISSSTAPTVNSNFTLYGGAHGLTATSTSTFEVYFKSTDTFWVDFAGIGTELEEISGAAMTNEDQVQVNYSARNYGLWYSSETQNFFQTYDGDDSDGSVDYCFVYYQWDNRISGGGEEEADDAFRERGRNALDVAAKGTKDAIRNAILEIDAISQAEVSDYNDDSTIDPGICNVYVLARGFTITPSLNQEIIDVIEDTRAAGVRVDVFAPLVRYTNFELNVVYDDSNPDYLGTVGLTLLENLISSAMDDFFAVAKINEALYFSDLIGFLIDEVPGVVAGYSTWDDATTPTVSDDDYDTGYAYDGAIILDDPKRVSGQETGATVVIQRGNSVTITLKRKSVNL